MSKMLLEVTQKMFSSFSPCSHIFDQNKFKHQTIDSTSTLELKNFSVNSTQRTMNDSFPNYHYLYLLHPIEMMK